MAKSNAATGRNVVCRYRDLINPDEPLVINGDWLEISVRGLAPGELYVMPIYLWAPELRPIRVEILNPEDKTKPAFATDFILGPELNANGQGTWTPKRYKLNEKRHNGEARVRIGWDDSKNKAQRNGVSFRIFANKLTSKTLRRQARIDKGKCPECGKVGYWHMMAMLCPDHGKFIG